MADGLHGKYIICKADTGKPVDYPCFVLRADGEDLAAIAAIEAYASATCNANLRKDLHSLAQRLRARWSPADQ